MAINFIVKKCQPCQAGSGKLSEAAIAEYLPLVPNWTMDAAAHEGKGELRRTFKFKNYHESMAFVNATAWVSHREDHHPDIELGYNKVTMRYTTHSAGGVTENDFICAAKVDALVNM
ncbi:MAG TPA: 4a-hydroxytetrahydrobiopterin dehydratase [Phycisphaerae bacterium]|jgi:4a-hydroxytetrahydrobiopterin dehydratase